MALIVIAAVWKQISYNFLFFLAGLQSIPKSLIEAAAIDGARPWRRFWTIVFPLLSPMTFFLLVINIVYAFFETFAIIDATTQGGPGKETAILVYKVYYDGFKALDLGGSAAQSVVLMVDRHHPHRHPVPLRREEGAVLSAMVERSPVLDVVSHVVLGLGVLVVAFPVYVTLRRLDPDRRRRSCRRRCRSFRATNMLENYRVALVGGETSAGSKVAPVGRMMWVSLVSALVITIGKIAISLLSAFAIVYFRFPVRSLCFWLDLRHPDAAGGGADLSHLQGRVRPRHAQHLRRAHHPADRLGDRDLPVPPVLPHRARRAGRGGADRRRRAHALLQGRAAAALATSIAALFVIQFIYGWNQYLWPLLMTTDESMYPVVMGIKRMFGGGDAANEWNVIMATAILAMIPPALVVLLMQRWFVKGLVDTEK